MKVIRRTIALCALTCASYAVTAGEIYICKSANGQKTFQNIACSSGQAEIKHKSFDPAESQPAPTDQQAYGQQGIQVQQAPASANGRTIRAMDEGQHVTQYAPAGYECTVGRHHWTSVNPCPATYAISSAVPIQGFTGNGTFVNGTGVLTQREPVQQRALDQAALCDGLNAGSGVGGSSDTERSYEKNKLKMQNGCG